MQDSAKLIRILIYPNITYRKDLTKDSYVDVISKMLIALNELRQDLFFYIFTPEYLDCFNYPNVKQILLDFPSYPNQMRIHFNSEEILAKLPDDIDIVFSHLPEHTLQLKNLIYNKTEMRPEFFGYCHWFETKKVTSYEANVLPINILGLLNMSVCFLNTEYQKELVLKEVSSYFCKEVLTKLDKLLRVFKLGGQKHLIANQIVENTANIIAFNHRPDAYKDFDNFIAICDELYKQRQDFAVWIPLLQTKIRDYVVIGDYNKLQYYDYLKLCKVGFAPKQEHGGWSVAAVDGLMNGCPYVFYDASYYRELYPNADFFKNNKEALVLLNKYLDDVEYRNIKATEALQFVQKELTYEKEIEKISLAIDSCCIELLDERKNSSLIDKFIDVVKHRGIISKKQLLKELKLGPRINFTSIKRNVLARSNVFEVLSDEPNYIYKT